MTKITSFDLTPFYRNTVGIDSLFDRITRNLDMAATGGNYPPYNIIKVDEDEYTIEMAVAGFSKNDIEIVQKEQTLTIEGRKDKEDDNNYIHKGIAARNFKHTFALADYVEVETANFTDGILSVKIKRELPEDKKPRTITVK